MTASKPDMERVRKTVIDLQVAVLDARERESALTENTRRLEEELSSLRNWQKDLSEYQLANIGSPRQKATGRATEPSVNTGGCCLLLKSGDLGG